MYFAQILHEHCLNIRSGIIKTILFLMNKNNIRNTKKYWYPQGTILPSLGNPILNFYIILNINVSKLFQKQFVEFQSPH